MRAFESELTRDARKVFNNPKLRVKDILEWSTGSVTPEEGEVVAKVGAFNVAILKEHDKRDSVHSTRKTP